MTSYKHKPQLPRGDQRRHRASHHFTRHGRPGPGRTAAPKRLLVTHHPVGTCRYAWAPTGSGTTYTQSRS